MVGARFTPSGGIVPDAAAVPNWVWTVFGCLSMLVVGFGVLWWSGLTAPASAPVVAAAAPAPPAAPLPLAAIREPEPSQPGHGASIQVLPLGAAAPVAAAAPAQPAVRGVREPRRFRFRHRGGVAAAAAATLRGDDGAPSEAASPSPAGADKGAAAAANAKDDDGEAEEAAAPPPPPVKRTAAERAVLGDDETAVREPQPREVVETALKALGPSVRRCFIKFQIPGSAQVKLVATPEGGEAEGVTVSGEFEGTPTGECVAAAVSAAPLPAFKGNALRLSHVYVLR